MNMTLEKQQFQHLLFKVAFCTIACDGHIDEMEIKEMKALDEESAEILNSIKGLI